MRRILAGGLHAGVAALLLSVAGCDGSGVKEGIPKDLTPAASLDSLKTDIKARGAPPSGAKKAGTPIRKN
jgi:hypothetical protein